MGLQGRPKSLEELRGPLSTSRSRSPVAARALADTALDPAVVPGALRSSELRTVLLTGASGFLGAYLVHELVNRLDVRVRCMVRATGSVAAQGRVESALRRHRLWSPDTMRNVEAAPGDLTAPRLGLNAADYGRLADTTDAIVHNGARVNHAEPYERLRAANVTGTVEILRLACRSAAIPVHFVSTTSVVAGQDSPIREIVPGLPRHSDGYVLGKWVAEVLMTQAAARGLPVVIHRPDRICGATATGATGTDDAFWTIVRAIVRLGVAPSITDAAISLVPADYVASAIAHTVGQHRPFGGQPPVHHLVNHTSITLEVILDRLRIKGFPVEIVSPEDFVTELREAALTDLGMARALILSQTTGTETSEWDDTTTRRALSGSGIVCPPMTAELIDRHLDYLTEVGFLPNPAT
ncbi:thioester reductase domain-containing protein [Nocardia sp. NPDC060256]|uniref:thioester reductase domain-containing protein n=1 Tax=unclassified Nocardia TaxID=2637762 RepID=UPI00364B2376